jgi:phosphodiesterase/alkaline phosphatase D-like protein
MESLLCRKSQPLLSHPPSLDIFIQTGAQNHQPVCSANSTSPDGEKAYANCDRDEGTATDRFNAAAQAYLEYLPLRTAPGSMGVVRIGTITQVIEWGKLATFVLFDTRITARSKEPSLKSSSE